MPASSPSPGSWFYTNVTSIPTNPYQSPPLATPQWVSSTPTPPPIRAEQPFQDFEVRLSTHSNSPPGELAIFTKYDDDSNWDPFPWADVSPANLRRLAAALNNYLVRQAHGSSGTG